MVDLTSSVALAVVSWKEPTCVFQDGPLDLYQ